MKSSRQSSEETQIVLLNNLYHIHVAGRVAVACGCEKNICVHLTIEEKSA